jgi:hypothetical protein
MENRTALRARRAKARRVLRARTRTHRAAARIARRGVGTLTAHAVAAGLPIREARSAAGTMRKCAERLGVAGTPGTSYAGRAKARSCRRYTRAEVAVIAVDYGKRARKAAYKAMAARLALAA